MESKSDASTEMEFEYTGKGCAVPKDVSIVRFHPSVVEVENDAFQYCNKLRGVLLNDGLQKIYKLAFSNCTSLSSITLPSTVTAIGEGAFCNCCNLREVVLNGLQKIGVSAFYDCRSLSSITLPSTVTEIGNYAFYNCHNLREIVLHGVLREIGQSAFHNCTLSLERFTFPTISTRLDTLIQTGHWSEIENEVDEVRGVVERSGSELYVLSTQSLRGGGRHWNAVKRDLEKIIGLISYYKIKEATSIFELALWKFKLGQVDKANPIPRKKCRMDAPGPVKDIILTYLR